MRGLFITGTDTGIGKTIVTAGCVRRLRQEHMDVVPMKPVQTGAAGETFPDLAVCLAAAGLTPSPDERTHMCPFRFEPACSPHLAARLAGTRVTIADIVPHAEELCAGHTAVVVEGAGGIMVPINDDELMLDLMTALAFPVILVARGTLGTINHTLLSLQVLEAHGLPVAGVILNDGTATPRDYIRVDNPHTITHFGGVPIIAEIPFIASLANPADSHSGWDALDRSLANATALLEAFH